MKKHITFILLFSCSFLSAQNENYPQYFPDNKTITQDAFEKGFTKIAHNLLLTDCESPKDSFTYKTHFSDVWQYKQRDSYEYDELSRETFEAKETDYPGNIFRLYQTYTTEYSENESIIYKKQYNSDTDLLQDFSRRTNILNSDGNVESYLEDMYISSTDTYEPYRKSILTYTSSGIFESENIKIYDANLMDYIPNYRRIDYRNVTDETLLDSIVYQEYDLEQETWSLYYSQHYFWDEENRLIDDLTYTSNSGAVILILRDSITYDNESEDYINHISYNFSNDSPVPTLLFIIKNYFENGLNTVDSIYSRDSEMEEFSLEGVEHIDYDSEDREIQITSFTASSNGEVHVTAESNEYYQECTTSAIITTKHQIECQVPNPLTNGQSVICIFENTDHARLNLYDLLGRKVLQKIINSGESITFNKLPTNGVYFLTIENEEGIMMQKKMIIANEQ